MSEQITVKAAAVGIATKAMLSFFANSAKEKAEAFDSLAFVSSLTGSIPRSVCRKILTVSFTTLDAIYCSRVCEKIAEYLIATSVSDDSDAVTEEVTSAATIRLSGMLDHAWSEFIRK